MKRNKRLHLTDEEVACCAEAFQNNTFEHIKKNTRNHLKHCHECANMVLAVHQVMYKMNGDDPPPFTLELWKDILNKK